METVMENKFNWKFVNTGHKGTGVKFMFCNGDKLVKEFSPKLNGRQFIADSIRFEVENILEFSGPTIADYIIQYNYNQIAIREYRALKTDIAVMQLKDFNRLQKELNK